MDKQLEEIIKSKANLTTEKEYRTYDAINYSTLSSLDSDPMYVDKEFKDTPSTIMGSVVDCLLTGGDYDASFITETVSRPSGKNGDIVDALLKLKSDDYLVGESIYTKGDVVIFKEMVQDAYNNIGINPKSMKFETALTNFKDKGGVQYYMFLKNVGKKTVVSYEIWNKAVDIVNTLKTHQYTKDYFKAVDSPDFDILFQVPIVFHLPANVGTNVKGKGLLDMILINHKDKCVIPVDLKTTSSKASEFPSSFLKWKYYLQSSLYSYGLGSICTYEVQPFKFVVAPTLDIYRPMVYRVSKKTLEIGRFGGTNPQTGAYMKGWEQLSKELIWMRETGNNVYSKEVYDNEGCLTIDVFDKW